MYGNQKKKKEQSKKWQLNTKVVSLQASYIGKSGQQRASSTFTNKKQGGGGLLAGSSIFHR